MLDVEAAEDSKRDPEIELKLGLDPRSAASAARLPLLLQSGVDKPTTRALRSIYFDTSNADLRRLQTTLRLRRSERAWRQTLEEADAATAGLHVRAKTEHPVASQGLDLDKIDDDRLRKKLRKWQAAGELMPRFETVVKRTTWLMNTPTGGLVECALDLGEVRTLDGRIGAPLCEVELVLKSGPVSELFAVARGLVGSLPLTLEHRSKADRGYALWRRELASNPSKAGLPILRTQATASQAMTEILNSGLAHLQRNWQAAANARRYNPEHVHQMRVATRRLRTAFAVFGQIDVTLKTHPLVAELRWFAASLGEARNWDVLLAETLPRLSIAFPEEGSLYALARKAGARRRRARAVVKEALRSARYLALVLDLSEFAVGIRQSLRLAIPAKPLAAQMLTRRHRQLRRRARYLTALSTTERHELRIAAKKLRYTAEFFESLFAGGKHDRFLRRFNGLQKALGALNDLATTRALMTELAGNTDADVLRSLALCSGWSAGLEKGSLPELARRWKSVQRTARFWPDRGDKINAGEPSATGPETDVDEPPPLASQTPEQASRPVDHH